MLTLLKHFAVAFTTFLIIDLVWILAIANNFYKKYLGTLLRPTFLLPPALLFYVLYIVGLLYFIIEPSLQAKSISMAARNGAFLGMLCYATYDLTNYATLQNWSLTVTIVDIVWGTVLTSAICSITTYILLKF